MNPVAGSCPKFRVIALTDNPLDFSTIDIEHSDSFGHQFLVGELGKPPEMGKNMHPDLQNRYPRLTYSSSLMAAFRFPT